MTSKRFIFIALLIYLALQIGPALSFLPGTDEGYYGNPLRNFIYEGNIGSSVSYKDLGFDKYCFYVFPAFLFLELAITPFGYHLYTLRLLMLGVSVAFLVILYEFSKTWFNNRNIALLSLTFSIVSLSILRIARTVRPEILVLFFLMSGLYCCSQAISRKDKKMSFFSGFCAGLCFAAHPIGIMATFNCLVFFATSNRCFSLKKSIPYFFFGNLVIVTLMVLFFFLTDWNIFILQMKYMNYNYASRILPSDNISTLEMWYHNLKSYYFNHRFFEIFILSILSVLCIKQEKQRVWKPFLICLIINFLFLIFIYPNKFIDYTLTLQLPHLLILASASAYKALENRTIWTLTAIAVYLTFSLGAIFYNIYRSYEYGSYTSYKEKFRTTFGVKSLNGLKILGNPQYLFAVPEAHLIDCEVVRDMVDYGKASSWEEALNNLKLQYIIVDDYFMDLGEQWPRWPAFTHKKNLLNYLEKKATPIPNFNSKSRNLSIFTVN